MAASRPAIAYPLLWSDNVAAISRWAQQALGFVEQWAAPGPDGNQWWVHAETGMLDTLRSQSGTENA